MTEKRSDSSFEYLFKEIEHVSRELSPETELEYIKRAKSGDKEAVEKLIVATLPQIFEMAKYLASVFQLGNDIIPDLVNEGNRGVLVAIKKFDPTKANRLYSYAWYWARDYMIKFLKSYLGDIKFPDSIIRKIRQIKRAEREYISREGKNPTDEDIADAVGLSSHEVRALRAVSLSPRSLDRAIDEEEDNKETLVDIVGQKALPSPEKYYAEVKMNQLVKEIFGFLSKKESEIIKLSFGFEDGKRYTLEEIGNKLGITKQRVSQLRDRALRRLREKYGDRANDIFKQLYEE